MEELKEYKFVGRKFAWLPVELYKATYWRDGCAWFSYYYLREDGKAFRTNTMTRDY